MKEIAYGLVSVLGIGLAQLDAEKPGLTRLDEVVSAQDSIEKPDVVIIPRDRDDNGYVDKLLDDPLLREPIQPFVDSDFLKKYSVYDEDPRVERFESVDRDKKLYGEKPDINDWVKDDFEDSKILFFFQGTRLPYSVEENGVNRELKNWKERMDCPTCEVGKPWFADIIKDLRNEYGSQVGGAVMVVGRNSIEETPYRLLTSFSGESKYGVPQVGVAFRGNEGWEVDNKYTMTWNEFNGHWWKNPGFFDEVFDKADVER